MQIFNYVFCFTYFCQLLDYSISLTQLSTTSRLDILLVPVTFLIVWKLAQGPFHAFRTQYTAYKCDVKDYLCFPYNQNYLDTILNRSLSTPSNSRGLNSGANIIIDCIKT